jgi:hypothetical protein
MVAVYSSETVVFACKSTRRYNPEDKHRHLRRRENFKSETMWDFKFSRRRVALMMEAARTSETSVDIQLRTRQYIPEDSESNLKLICWYPQKVLGSAYFTWNPNPPFTQFSQEGLSVRTGMEGQNCILCFISVLYILFLCTANANVVAKDLLKHILHTIKPASYRPNYRP